MAMTVRQLIAALQALPADLEVGYIWDGCMYSEVEAVWATRGGKVAISDGDVVYDTKDRPFDAPTSDDDRYWRRG